MKKIILLNASLLAFSIATQASAATAPCNGFKVTVTNKLGEELVISKAQVTNAVLQPGILQIHAKSSQVFTVNSTQAHVMNGEIVLNTTGISSKTGTIKFTLTSQNAVCELEDLSDSGALVIKKGRQIGGVHYTVK